MGFELPQEDSEKIQRSIEFVLKLAAADNISDDEAAESMLNQLNENKASPNFSEMLVNLDPLANKSGTKSLSVEAKNRLRKVLDSFLA
ncbi:MAG: hypothetical protein PHF79_04155 [Candidatus Pacebacteria bacterium]|nr:hypothetical protein [Candidatus Paceibacterota bacterium]